MHMPLRKLIFLSGLVLAVVAMSPAAAMGAAKGTNRPLTGTLTTITTVNLITGAGTQVSSGHLSHLGKVTGSADLQFTAVGSNGFSFTGTATTVAANGNKLFTTTATLGTGTLGPPISSTSTNTIVGGTGRFADASGTYTGKAVSTSVAIIGSIETVTSTVTLKGTISY